MNWIISLIESLPPTAYWAIAAVVIILAFMFRHALASKIKDLRSVVFEKGRLQLEFKEKAIQAQEVAKVAGVGETTHQGPIPVDLPEREIVVNSWDSLNRIVHDAAVTGEIQLTPQMEPRETVSLLQGAKFIPTSLGGLINTLYNLGKNLADNPAVKPNRVDALLYKRLVDNLVAWMRRNVIEQKDKKKSKPKPPEVRRATQVGGYFPAPAPGHPAAILVGLSGLVRGQHVAVEKDIFRIGATPENDLSITGDDYVSGNHACLRYESGSLYLSDQDSSNGTFLNEKRVTSGASALTPGDRIRLGSAMFEVTAAPGGSPGN